MSTRIQWKKSVRGRSAGTSRSGWLTSSPRLGTSKSWQISANDWVPAGTSLHSKCGLRFSEKVAPPLPSGLPAAYRSGIRSPLPQLSLHNFMMRSCSVPCRSDEGSDAPDDVGAFALRASHHLQQGPRPLAQADVVTAGRLVRLVGTRLAAHRLLGRDGRLERRDRRRQCTDLD